jgi:hypothetical protein
MSCTNLAPKYFRRNFSFLALKGEAVGSIQISSYDGEWQTEFFFSQIMFFRFIKSKNVKIRDLKFSFPDTKQLYLLFTKDMGNITWRTWRFFALLDHKFAFFTMFELFFNYLKNNLRRSKISLTFPKSRRVIPCQLDKLMSPWVENFKIDILCGFYI